MSEIRKYVNVEITNITVDIPNCLKCINICSIGKPICPTVLNWYTSASEEACV